jgi:hypothetical protein
MGWRQDHMIPEPFLVMTGMTYLLPAYLAYEKSLWYCMASSLFVMLTTMSFHWFRTDLTFAIDVIAILNYVACGLYNCYYTDYSATGVWIGAISYSLYSYFVGQQLNILSFDPDWATQMFFHGLIHFSTAYSAWFLFNRRQFQP